MNGNGKMTHEEISRLAGQSRSPKKVAAVTANMNHAREVRLAQKAARAATVAEIVKRFACLDDSHVCHTAVSLGADGVAK